MSTLPAAISSLSVAEKYDLVDALLEDLATHNTELSDEEKAILDRRMEAYREIPSAVIPWEEQ